MDSSTRSRPPAPSILPLPRMAGAARVRTAPAAGQRKEHSFSLEQVSCLLWHGLGLNRHGSGGRAALSGRRRRDLEVYVCLPDGGYRYDAPEHALYRVTSHDCRLMAGCATASTAPALALVYVTCGLENDDVGSEESGRMTDTDASTIAGNVAAYCARAGLHVHGAEWFPHQLGTMLGLDASARVALTQTVQQLSTH